MSHFHQPKKHDSLQPATDLLWFESSVKVPAIVAALEIDFIEAEEASDSEWVVCVAMAD